MTRSQGLTLVELLVATALFLIVAAGIYGAYAAGVRAWAQAEELFVTAPRMTRCLEHLASQARNSLVLPEASWAGGPEGLMFATVEQGIFPVVVTYHRTPEGWLLERRHSLAEPHVHERLWVPRLTTFSLRYAYLAEDGTLTWEPTWSDPEQVPKLLRITLATASSLARPLTKTVLIPTGVFGTYERGGAT